jgi:hypothetical protein
MKEHKSEPSVRYLKIGFRRDSGVIGCTYNVDPSPTQGFIAIVRAFG